MSCTEWIAVAVDGERLAITLVAVGRIVSQGWFLSCHVEGIGKNRRNPRTVVGADG